MYSNLYNTRWTAICSNCGPVAVDWDAHKYALTYGLIHADYCEGSKITVETVDLTPR